MKIVLQIVFALLAFPGVAFSQLFIYQVEETSRKDIVFLGINTGDADSFSVLHLVPQVQSFVVAKELARIQMSKGGKTLTVYHADKTVELIEYQESLERLSPGTCTNGTKIHKTRTYSLLACKSNRKDKKGTPFVEIETEVSEKGIKNKKEIFKTFHDPTFFSRIYRKERVVFEKGKQTHYEIHTLIFEFYDSPPPEEETPSPRRPSYDKAVV